ncbi:MAG: hypothetical protein AAGI48_06925 [Verrucomicrobiota bacterium]
METPESIERMLESRLVPGGMSEEGSAQLESLIDELAGESPSSERRWLHYLLGGAAAALAMAASFWMLMPSGEVPPVAGVDELFSEVRDVVLLEDVEGVVSAEANQDLVSDPDGSLHRAWHVQVVSEEHFHDEKSGEVVRVVHPRDELVLMPVTSF